MNRLTRGLIGGLLAYAAGVMSITLFPWSCIPAAMAGWILGGLTHD